MQVFTLFRDRQMTLVHIDYENRWCLFAWVYLLLEILGPNYALRLNIVGSRTNFQTCYFLRQ